MKAITVLSNFWIVEDRGNKIGTIKCVNDQYEFYDNRNNSTTVLDSLNGFDIISTSKKQTVNDTVYGYSCNTEQAHNIDLQDTVPIYTKTATSKQYFAAGYYGILFPMGWRPSFCPRLKTLNDYTYIGPFKNESDMNLAIKRKGQEHEVSNS